MTEKIGSEGLPKVPGSAAAGLAFWRWPWLLAGLAGAMALLVVLLALPAFAAAQAETGRLDPDLRPYLAGPAAEDRVRVIIWPAQPGPTGLEPLPPGGLQRRQALVAGLRKRASTSQASLLKYLEALQAKDASVEYRSLWIVNAVAARLPAEMVSTLARRADVGRVALDRQVKLLEPPEKGPDADVLGEQGDAPGGVGSQLAWNLDLVRAAHAWYGLGADGSGATVAIMDSGVDWTHPALSANYRGRGGSAGPVHAGNWYDAVEGSPAPVDPNGHGTHVAGTAVGQDGIGVAPGADWIAVRMIDAFGYGYLSEIHEAFQWLLAPNGDPSLSPDVVNGSWSGSPETSFFEQDLAALRLAGIVPVFAAGNAGPAAGTVGSPASYGNAIAVGASDDLDEVVWFSARGPSGPASELKPELVAPGVSILSTLPGDAYGISHGTSMAAPHVSGAFALLRALDRQASVDALTRVITSTAAGMAAIHPNNDSGWGRLDVYAAAVKLAEAGSLAGEVRGPAAVLAGAAITVTTPEGGQLPFLTDAGGQYQISLKPGLYQVEAFLFGHAAEQRQNVRVVAGQETSLDLSLDRLPYGRLRGSLRDMTTSEPISGQLTVVGTPVTAEVGPDGHFDLELPEGRFRLTASALGYRYVEHEIQFSSGVTIEEDLLLPAGPRVLLVDSGSWYFDSSVQPYVQALHEAGFSHHLWSIRHPFFQVPTTNTLSAYDVVVWSAPRDAPILLGANVTLAHFLAEGGNLLIAGQDVGELESSLGGSFWWLKQLQADYLGNADPPYTLAGVPGSSFAGLAVRLNGPNSIVNQVSPDASEPRTNSLTEPLLFYGDGRAAGLEAGLCQPFKIIQLGFGLEGVDGAAVREDIISRSFGYFSAPPQEAGLRVLPANIDTLVPPGSQVTYTLQIQNLSETLTDTFTLALAGSDWPASVDRQELELGPCAWGQVEVSVMVPADIARDVVETFALQLDSANAPAISSQVEVRLKTPGRLLLVDDDRWYDQEPIYRAALAEAGLLYDFWETQDGPREVGGPGQELLNAYETVIWYTGYDWFRPITALESESLATYLEQGGRLLLTSQDYMYYHQDDRLTRDFLGVAAYRESVTPTVLYQGNPTGPYAGLPDPQPLSYGSYQNHGDGLVGEAGTEILLWHNGGLPAALGNRGDGWRSLFWAVPLETLPADQHAQALSQSLGWLGDLGESSFTVDQASGPRNGRHSRRTYTVQLRNDGDQPVEVLLTNPLPANLHLDGGSLSGGQYDRATETITWQGSIGAGQGHTLQYQARPGGQVRPGERIDNRLVITVPGEGQTFLRTAPLWIEAPDLRQSTVTAAPVHPAPGEEVQVELRLHNDGQATSPYSITLWLAKAYFEATAEPSIASGRAWLEDGQIRWQGDLPAGQSATLTITGRPHSAARAVAVPIAALIDDGQTGPLIRHTEVYLVPRKTLLPLIVR